MHRFRPAVVSDQLDCRTNKFGAVSGQIFRFIISYIFGTDSIGGEQAIRTSVVLLVYDNFQ